MKIKEHWRDVVVDEEWHDCQDSFTLVECEKEVCEVSIAA